MSYRNLRRHPVTPSPRHRWPLLAALVLLCLRPEVQAETISIVPSDNAHVNKEKPNDNHSEAQQFSVMSNGGQGKSQFTYLRFDLSPLAGGTITSASLDLYWLSASGDSPVYVCALKDLADGGKGTTETSWSGNLIWNTRPDGTGNLPNAYTSDLLASLPFKAADPPHLVSFNLTSKLPGLLESDTNSQLTLILYGSTATNRFASLANTGGYPVPTLNVTGEGFIPEPGTLALLGMALLGLGWYAWRRRR